MITSYRKSYYRLRIDTTQALRSDFDPDAFLKETREPNQSIAVWLIDKKIDDFLNRDWLDYMQSLGLPVQGFLMFYRAPGTECSYAHTDITWHTGKPYPFAINWVFSPGDDSEMIWYDVPNESGTLMIEPQSNVKYLHWPVDTIKDQELDRVIVGSTLTMVNTSIAHNVITHTKPRWAISLRGPIWKPEYQHFDSWESSVDFFTKLGIIEDTQ